MKAICIYFQVHQPQRFRKYRFFDIGADHYYYDDFANEAEIQQLARESYLPANKMIMDNIIKHNGEFKLTYSISGSAIEMFELYAPEVITSLKALADTGSVEFLAETNTNTLSSLVDKDIFARQIEKHSATIERLFGQKPSVLKNSDAIYSDEIGEMATEMGFKAMVTEGAKHILGWKSPDYIYSGISSPNFKLLLRNSKLSNDITFKFSDTSWDEYPLTADKFSGWLGDSEGEVSNIFLDYSTLGKKHNTESGIFDFFSALTDNVIASENLKFSTPSEAIEITQDAPALHVMDPISWAGEARDLSTWLGNTLQSEAFEKLYALSDAIQKCDDPMLQKEWDLLQSTDHFAYMSTDQESFVQNNPYGSPYDAFINYMNVLSDLKIRLNTIVPENGNEIEISNLNKVVTEIKSKLKRSETENKRYKSEIDRIRQIVTL